MAKYAKYTVREVPSFRHDRDRMFSRGYPECKLNEVIAKLANGQKLDPTYRDHPLRGKYSSCRECHIGGDWLLVYKIFKDVLVLELLHTGTHSDLFKK